MLFNLNSSLNKDSVYIYHFTLYITLSIDNIYKPYLGVIFYVKYNLYRFIDNISYLKLSNKM